MASVKDSIEFHLLKASEAMNMIHLEEALHNITISKELSLKSNNKTYRAKTNSILAKLYFQLGDYKNAEFQIKKALDIQKEEKDSDDLADTYYTYATILTELSEFDLASGYLEKATEILEKQADEKLKMLIRSQYGLLDLKQNHFKEALQEFTALLPVINTSKYPYEKAQLYLNKTKAELELKELDVALISNDSAMAIASTYAFEEIKSESFKLCSIIYEMKEEAGLALENLKAYQKIKDSLFVISKAIIAEETRSKLNLDESTIIIEELTEENSQQQASLKLGRLTTILSIALITILSLLTLSLYKNNNLRARANELLQEKNTELIIAKENAERASEAKVQFLSTITHELRTPLYAVTGLTHLLLEESPTPNQKEHLNSLKFSGEYLLSLINNILDLNKLEANKVELEHTSFNLKKRINDVLIALNKSAKDRNNKIIFDFDNEIPQKLKGDPLKISQILINLIGNSIKFTNNGNIWIAVNQIRRLDKTVYLRFEIKDNGVGISEKKQQSIFENFTQGSVQINRKFGGTGLGLSIVKNLLALMNSEIHLESELNKGSKFYFEIKFEIYEDESANYQEEAKKIDYSAFVGKNVLIVEDNKINQLITRKILEKNKMICDVADNGSIAINKVKEFDFDLILMDIHMPGISGIEATKQIREFNTSIPIVALTAVTLDDNLDEFYDNGFNDIIPKPYKTEEFFTKLHKAFTTKKTAS
ncbi:ATP-binding protein [Aquimarina sp. ERC-38]|uniref:response regulator n=1 Tax=Aquimarina sp. ERC-38 TaxID=2949996 RepID=UPI002247ED15|nr:response regulator [Aquimarina sp. ERC-38]UZO80582.1 ATP-binding protein [Aquimarina sp. ERC-38]